MVSYNVYKATSSGAYVEGVCLASDEKPVVGIANGSILFAVDASNGETTRLMYDQESMTWIEAKNPDSSAGGLSPLLITESWNGSYFDTGTSWQDVYDAIRAGMPVVVHLLDSGEGDSDQFINHYRVITSCYAVRDSGEYYALSGDSYSWLAGAPGDNLTRM